MSIPEITKFREKYPQYSDIDDMTLAKQLAGKYKQYADLPDKVKAGNKPRRKPIKLESANFNEPYETSNPAIAAVKAASEWIPYGKRFANAPNWLAAISPFVAIGRLAAQAREEAGPIKVKGIPAQVVGGLTAAAPIIAGAASPLVGAASKIPLIGKSTLAASSLGLGGYEAARTLAGGDVENVPKAFASGAASGLLYGIGGKLGATVAQPIGKLTKFAPNIGSAAGAATASALMAPEGEKISSGIIGGAFGAKHPQKPMGFKTPAQLYRNAGRIYRKIINPGRSEYKSIEVRKGEKFDKYFELAARERLPIYRDEATRKLDTSKAREIVRSKAEANDKKLDNILKLDPEKKFSLVDLWEKSVLSSNKKYSNAKERAQAVDEITNYIEAEMQVYGEMVNASTLNKVKRGMWSVGYSNMNPTSKTNARIIGHEAKSIIENSYKHAEIRKINQVTADYLTLNGILENAHGRVVQGGKLGGYFSGGTGAVVGGMMGYGIPGIGPVGGAILGKGAISSIHKHLTNPEVMTSRAGRMVNKAQNAEIQNPVLDRIFNKFTK